MHTLRLSAQNRIFLCEGEYSGLPAAARMDELWQILAARDRGPSRDTMMFDDLKEEVCKCNRELARSGLVTLTWGNVERHRPAAGLVVIKPSGVPYDQLEPGRMVVVDLDGKVVEGDLRPSSDTPTHLVLYRGFEQIGGIAHSHSRYATMFAQARREIPCLGTTHADHFSVRCPSRAR